MAGPWDRLESREIHVWSAWMNVAQTRTRALYQTLNDDERARAERYRDSAHRRRSVVSRGILRERLATYMAVAPRSLVFEYGPFGKPLLRDPDGLSFNVSHSGELLQIAIANRGELGIDVERLLPMNDYNRVAQLNFSPSEVEALRSMPLESRRIAFYRCWTCKEAYAKARALGMSVVLHDFDVSLSGQAALLATRESEAHTVPITLQTLHAPHGYVAALACTHRIPRIREMWLDAERGI